MRTAYRENVNVVKSLAGGVVLAKIASVGDAVFSHNLIAKLLHPEITRIN
jgi:hypothetical protein